MKFFLSLGSRARARATHRSSSDVCPHTTFPPFLVLTDKMAFTCRHVLILDRGRRIAAAIAPDFTVAAAFFFYYSRKDGRFYAATALTLHFIFGFLRVPYILHSIVECVLIKRQPSFIVPFITHNVWRSKRTIETIMVYIYLLYEMLT